MNFTSALHFRSFVYINCKCSFKVSIIYLVVLESANRARAIKSLVFNFVFFFFRFKIRFGLKLTCFTSQKFIYLLCFGWVFAPFCIYSIRGCGCSKLDKIYIQNIYSFFSALCYTKLLWFGMLRLRSCYVLHI